MTGNQSGGAGATEGGPRARARGQTTAAEAILAPPSCERVHCLNSFYGFRI